MLFRSGIRIEAAHGVYPEEKENPQPFIIDVEARLAPRSFEDDLATTVDYSQLATQIVAVATAGSVDLIETLAERVAEVSLSHRLIEEVEVSVHKPQAPIPLTFSDVAVVARRSRRGGRGQIIPAGVQ